MKAVEIEAKTDKSGHLNFKYKLNKMEHKVRILLLFEDEKKTEKEEEKQWISLISKNPAFDFLHNPEEDIYSLNDGEPIND